MDTIKNFDEEIKQNMKKLIESYPNVLITKDDLNYIESICEKKEHDSEFLFNELLQILIPPKTWFEMISNFFFEDKILASYGEYLQNLSNKKSFILKRVIT